MKAKVSIIVLNWNNWEDTIECLESLYRIDYDNYNIIMVDNGSDDDSVEKIKEYLKGDLDIDSDFFKFNEDIKPLKYVELVEDEYDNLNLEEPFNRGLFIIKNPENYGFAEGNNAGIDFALRYLKPDYLEILNNDIVVKEDYLDEMVKVIQSDSNIGMVGPKIYFYDYKGRKDVQTAMGGYINWWISPGYNYMEDKVETEEPVELDWVTGASLMVRTDLPDIFLDKNFFFGAEDIDLSLRIKEAGYQIYLVPTSHIWHKISLSRYKKFNNLTKRFKNTVKSHFTLVRKHKKLYPLYYVLYSIEMVFIYGKKLIAGR